LKNKVSHIDLTTKTTTVSSNSQSIFINFALYKEFCINGTVKIIKKDSGPCEDAFFIQGIAAGVSDGVGGWSEYGVVSSDFSESLMNGCSNIIRSTMNKDANPNESNEMNSLIQDKVLFSIDDNDSSSHENQEIEDQFYVKHNISAIQLDPIKIINKAYNKIAAIGSATAVVCVLNGSELSCANIGDSGFLLIRFSDKNSPYILQDSKPQQHTFNTPFQLTKLPTIAQIEKKLKQKGYTYDQISKVIAQFNRQEFCKDAPEAAQLYKIDIQEGDLLIVATDGVFDNLFQDEIIDIIKNAIKGRSYSSVKPQEIATAIANRAYNKSKSRSEKTPFSETVRKVHGFNVVVFLARII